MSAAKFKDQSENLQLPMSTIMRGRECLEFSKGSGDICYCGADKSHHSDQALRNEHEDTKWKLETHTRIKRRSDVKGGSLEYFSHGTLRFRNEQASSSLHPQIVIKYANLYPDSDLRCLLQFMVDEWKLEPPKLVLSLEGDTENLSQADVKSIKNAARDTGAWIIKEGHTNLKRGMTWEGNGADAPVIGISPFPVDELKRTVYFTHYHPALEHESNSGLFPAVDFNYQVIGDTSDVRRSYLKTCHTHFLLVSNGNIQQEQDQTDGPRLIYQNLLGALSKLVPSDSHMTMPLLNLVAGNSPRFNELINRACSNDHPVLCIQPGHNSRQEE